MGPLGAKHHSDTVSAAPLHAAWCPLPVGVSETTRPLRPAPPHVGSLLQAVEELLAALGADGSLLVQVPSSHYADPLLPQGACSMPLRDALARCYDMRQPKHDLLRLLHAKLAAAASAAAVGQQLSITVSAGCTAADRTAAAGAAGEEAVTPKKRRSRGGGDSASEMYGGGMAGGHDKLCAGGCVVDKLEVTRGERRGHCCASAVPRAQPSDAEHCRFPTAMPSCCSLPYPVSSCCRRPCRHWRWTAAQPTLTWRPATSSTCCASCAHWACWALPSCWARCASCSRASTRYLRHRWVGRWVGRVSG